MRGPSNGVGASRRVGGAYGGTFLPFPGGGPPPAYSVGPGATANRGPACARIPPRPPCFATPPRRLRTDECDGPRRASFGRDRRRRRAPVFFLAHVSTQA